MLHFDSKVWELEFKTAEATFKITQGHRYPAIDYIKLSKKKVKPSRKPLSL